MTVVEPGKTVVAIALVAVSLHKRCSALDKEDNRQRRSAIRAGKPLKHRRGPVLVIVLSSTADNWVAHFKDWGHFVVEK